jgi:hypothetical protein
MKLVKFVILVVLCISTTYTYSQGASCSNPYSLLLDEVSRNFTISPSTSNASHCSGADFNGQGRETIFTITTDAAGSPVLIYVSTSPAQPLEITLYTGCANNGNCSNIQGSSSVCFSDGAGYWAPDALLTLAPNTTYYLRAWTANPGTLTLTGKNYNPSNNICIGATDITQEAQDDNNACNKASAEVTAVQLCAATLENTAFYRYVVESNGVSSVQLNEINCDNSVVGPENGFQVGFFVGSCASLSQISCASGSGGSFTATTGWLAAGTQVTVAIDGTSGSNCSYKISAFNATILPIILKYFTAWKRPDANRLTWSTTSEENFSYFEIEKSIDGVNFISIATKQGRGSVGRETSYVFDDNEVKALQYYRLKYVDGGGKSAYSNVLKVNRDDLTNAKVVFNNKVNSMLALRLIDLPSNNLVIKIIDNSGREVKTLRVRINPGENSFNLNTGSIPSGFYYLILSAENYKRTFSFVKS